MTKVLRRFITASIALAVLAGCGVAPNDGTSLTGTGDVATRPATDNDATTTADRSAPVRFARVLSRSESRVDGSLPLGIGEEPLIAERPAVRVDPPVIELVVADDDENVQIDQVWLDLAECESNQRWDYDGSSGYDGGLQFSPSTWRAVDGTDFAEYAWLATPLEQVTVAERLVEVQGWGAWPACSRKLGLR